MPITRSGFTAFAGQAQICRGDLKEVALAVKARVDAGDPTNILIFEDATGEQRDLDLRGTPDDAVARLDAHAAADHASGTATGSQGRGRPRLGVVPREVTLLPRHWAWLATQPGGASATLRRLVDSASRDGREADRVRRAQEATYQAMRVLAGDLPGFEEASRALFAPDMPRFARWAAAWPTDVRTYLLRLSEPVRAPERPAEV